MLTCDISSSPEVRQVATDDSIIGLDSCASLLAQALRLEYRMIIHYPKLLTVFPETESRRVLVALGTDSIRHADAVAEVLRSMGEEPPLPALEALPDLPLRQVFERQMEYEKLALALHTRAADLAPPEYQATLRRMAQEEELHIRGVQQILDGLK